MVKMNDTIEIHDGVAIVFCRHDDAKGVDITPEGAAMAYSLGKYMGDYLQITPPSYIIHSPVARARNTAKMHQIGMKVNDISNPRMKYDARLCENVDIDVAKKAVEEAIEVAKLYGYKTIEVVTHSNIPSNLAEQFGVSNHFNGDYGSFMSIKADNWDDMLAGKNVKEGLWASSSKGAVFAVIGSEQAELLSCLFSDKGNTEEFRNLLKTHTSEDTKKWAQDLLEGKEVEGIVPPTEYLEIYDAYMFWVQNGLLAVGITPEEMHVSSKSRLEWIRRASAYSNLAKKLLGSSAMTFSERFFINEEKYDGRDPKADGMGYTYPVFNAVAKRMEIESGKIRSSEREAGNQVVADILEDFPGYRDAMLVGEGRRVDNRGNETPDSKNPTYYIKEGDDGEKHSQFNVMRWKMLKNKRENS